MKRDNVKTFCAAGLVVAGLVGLAFGTPALGLGRVSWRCCAFGLLGG
jgi:hypothetical protein